MIKHVFFLAILSSDIQAKVRLGHFCVVHRSYDLAVEIFFGVVEEHGATEDLVGLESPWMRANRFYRWIFKTSISNTAGVSWGFYLRF